MTRQLIKKNVKQDQPLEQPKGFLEDDSSCLLYEIGDLPAVGVATAMVQSAQSKIKEAES